MERTTTTTLATLSLVGEHRINVVFMPLNVISGIGGMSEFSMMTKGIPWPIAYGVFSLGLVLVGWVTYKILIVLERRHVNF